MATVMDKIGGWEEGNEQEDQIEARFGASVWIYTKALVCNGQRNMDSFMMNKTASITEAVNRALEIYEDHEWIPPSFIKLQECKVLESFALRHRSSVRRAVGDVVVLGFDQPQQ